MPRADLVVPAAEANRSFSKLLRSVREGRRVIITSHGEPVAVLGPAHAVVEARRQGLEALDAHWAETMPVVVGAWTRDDLYARG